MYVCVLESLSKLANDYSCKPIMSVDAMVACAQPAQQIGVTHLIRMKRSGNVEARHRIRSFLGKFETDTRLQGQPHIVRWHCAGTGLFPD